MKNFTFAILLAFICLSSHSFTQTQDFAWAQSLGAGGSMYPSSNGYNICSDVNGNFFTTGSFSNPTATFGNYTINLNGGTFLVKYDEKGTVKWAISPSTTALTTTAITADKNGNVYLTGYFINGTAKFDTITLTTGHTNDMCLIKYDSLGNIQWAKYVGGEGNTQCSSINIDVDGNILMTGSFACPTITFGSTILNSSNTSNVFIVKYDESGNVLWAKSAASKNDGIGSCITTDASKNVLVTGWFQSDTISFEGTNVLLATNDYRAYFMLKYDAAGNLVWAKKAGASGGSAVNNYILTDSSGNIYMSGITYLNLTFGSTTLTNTSTTTNMFLVKYDKDANPIWAKNAVCTNYGSIGINGMAKDFADNIFLVGGVGGTATFGTKSITGAVNVGGVISGNRYYLAKYNTAGDEQFAQSGAYVYNGNGGSIDANSNFDIAGFTMNANGIGAITGTFRASGITLGGGSISGLANRWNTVWMDDYYIAGGWQLGITAPLKIQITANENTTFCKGDSITINTTISGGSEPYTYNWSDNSTSSSIIVKTPGDYKVTITDSKNDTVTSTVIQVTVKDFSSIQPSASFKSDTSVCADNQLEFTNTSSNALSYTWQLDGVTKASTKDFSNLFASEGTHTITLIAEQECGYIDSITQDILVKPFAPTAGFSIFGATTFCEGDSVTLKFDEVCATCSYIWSNGQTTHDIVVKKTGAYQLIASNSCGIDTTSTVQINVRPISVVTIQANGALNLCPNTSVQLDAGGGNSYVWSTGEISRIITANVADTYTVTVSSSCGTVVSDPVVITSNPTPTSPTIVANGSTALCNGDFLTLDASAADTYLWSTGETIQSIVVSNAGSYSVTTTDVNGCTASSLAIDVTISNPIADFSADESSFIIPKDVTFTSSTTGNIISYDWDFGDGATSTTDVPTHTYNTSGIYNISLTATDDNGCTVVLTKQNYIQANQLFSTTPVTTGVTTDITNSYFTSQNNGYYTTASGQVYYTSTSGSSWSPWGTTGAPYISSIGVAGNATYITGNNGFFSYSINNGSLWNSVNLATSAALNYVNFVNNTLGYVCGSNGTIYKYNGLSWVYQNIPTNLTFNSIYGYGTKAYAVGEKGLLYYYNGSAWNLIMTGITSNLNSVKFASALVGYAVGTSGTILRTGDGGLTWNTYKTFVNDVFTRIITSGVDSAWAVGLNGLMYQTVNGGLNWYRYSIGNTANLYALNYINGLGYIFGAGGKAWNFGSTTVAVNDTKTETNLRYKIYPNPSHQDAVLQFNISVENKHINMEVFDITGKQVMRIDNIKTNQTHIDRSNLQNGLYIYKLYDNTNLIGTGKLILN